MIVARPNSEKLLAVEDGYRESAESWKTPLRDLKRRGMTAPVEAVGDGALGFLAAAREVWPPHYPSNDGSRRSASFGAKLTESAVPSLAVVGRWIRALNPPVSPFSATKSRETPGV
jgi:hypothetical protein